MIRDWKVVCKDCLRPFHYSDQSARDAALRGESRPERCNDCRAKHNKATSRMGAAYLELEPGTRPVAAGALKAGRLGRIDRGPRPHQPEESSRQPVPEDTFGITDDHIRTLLKTMESHQVVVIEAPTGSGKSTFLPWRLLAPPAPYASDHVTRHGTIVVTQPRIEATQGIPGYIARNLHGARVGAGLDIGFRHSAARDRADSRNRLVYATDGTLLNMIRRGELHSCSVIVIDEAHERSLNIDLILALARRELIALPQLRLLVVSATINADAFVSFFQPELRVTSLQLPGKSGKPVYERWRASPPLPVNLWPARMPGEVAHTAYEVLRWIACGERPPDIPVDVPAYDGDILSFLPGKRAIRAAIDELEELLDDDDELAGKVEVLPLYAELPQSERTRALRPIRRAKSKRWRVIVSTNLAETSLTVEGIRHVVDSGLINATDWDVETLTTIVRPKPHSQSGLRQRRGRAGRTAPGVWHCLLTRDQFGTLTPETPPEIARAPLEGVVLAATAAGISDPASLRWMPPGPPPVEMRRTLATLRGMGAITASGDPTALGSELVASREPFSTASLLMCADEAGVAIEAAAVLAAVHERRWVHMLRWGSWPAAARLHADRLHTALLSNCTDDLDAVLMLVGVWESLKSADQRRFADRHLLSTAALEVIVRERDNLLQSLQSRTRTTQVRPVDPSLADRLRSVIAWAGPNAIYCHTAGQWLPELMARSDPEVVQRLHEGARPVLDADSLLSRRTAMPPFVFALVRDRRRRWISPLQEPEDQVTLSCCVALQPRHLAANVPLLVHLAGQRRTPRPQIPVVLPGERMLVEAVGDRSSGVQVRVLAMRSPMPIPDIEITTEADAGEDSGDLAQRAPSRADLDGLDVDQISAADYLQPEESAQPTAEEDPQLSQLPGVEETREAIAGLDVVASRFDAASPLVVVRWVAGEEVRVDPDPVTAAERFAARYELGDECTVQVSDMRTLQRDRRRVLIAQEAATGVEVLLTGLDIGFGTRDPSLEALPLGTSLRLCVAAIDIQAGLVQLTALPWTAAALSTLTQAGSEPFSGVIADARDESIHVLLTPDGHRLRNSDPPITVEIRADDLPPRPGEMALGQTVRVRLASRKSRTSTADLHIPDLKLPTGPFSRNGQALSLTGPVTVRDVLAMYKAARGLSLDDTMGLHRGLGQLIVRSMRPRARIIDVTGLSGLQAGQQARGVVVAVSDEQIVVEVDGGSRSVIPSKYLAWPGQQPPDLEIGHEVDVHVSDVDPQQGRLILSLRDPADDPFAQLRLGDQLDGRVITAGPHGLTMWATDPGVEIFIPARESGVRGDELTTAFPEDMLVACQLIEIDAARQRLIGSRWLYQEDRQLPAEILHVIEGPKGHEPRRLRPVLGDSVNLRLDHDTLIMRWTDDTPDLDAEEATGNLDALIHGMRAEIAVPHARPLDVPSRELIARQFGCLLKLMRHEGDRATWSVDAIFAAHVDVEDIREQVASLYPQLVCATRLRSTGQAPFREALSAFRSAERERRFANEPTSVLMYMAPYNYVQLGEEDTYEDFSDRLMGYGLVLEDPEWVDDHRIVVMSGPEPLS